MKQHLKEKYGVWFLRNKKKKKVRGVRDLTSMVVRKNYNNAETENIM